MKAFILLILFSLLAYAGGAQKTEQQYRLIDRRARATGFYPLPELAKKLTAPYTKEEDKVRSIFVWITAHINYDLERSRMHDTIRSKVYLPFQDSCVAAKDRWTTALAKAALQHKIAICAGYAALFKHLCDEAGLQAVIINGFARNYDDIGRAYRSNHAWNAVMLHNEWKLLDATWGASYLNREEDRIIQKFNPFYYCTPPEALILNHCPDDPKWTLLTNPPGHQEFAENPYIHPPSLTLLQSFLPRKGALERRVGDSASFHIRMPEPCQTIDIYEMETKKWIHYVPAPPPLPLEQFAILEVAEPDTSAADTLFDNKILFFTEVGDQLRFVYPVRHKGTRVIEIYVNDKRVLAYRVNGK